MNEQQKSDNKKLVLSMLEGLRNTLKNPDSNSITGFRLEAIKKFIEEA